MEEENYHFWADLLVLLTGAQSMQKEDLERLLLSWTSFLFSLFFSFWFKFFFALCQYNCALQLILQLCTWLPSLSTGVRLRVTLLWYKPCCFSNVHCLVIMLTRHWSLSQHGQLQPHSRSKALQLRTQL